MVGLYTPLPTGRGWGRVCWGESIGLPQMALHVYVAVGLERHPFFLQFCALAAPTWSRAPCNGHHAVAGQLFGPWRIAQCAPNHPGMTGPPCQRGDDAVGGDAAVRNLRHDVQHVVAKRTCLLRSHPVGIVVHHLTVTFSGWRNCRSVHSMRCCHSPMVRTSYFDHAEPK